MPKSRKRKGAKKYQPKSVAETEATPPAASGGVPNAPTGEPQRRFLAFFPYLSGAMMSGGLLLREFEMFIAFFAGAMVLTLFASEPLRRRIGSETVGRIFLCETTRLAEMMVYGVAGGFSQQWEIVPAFVLFGYVPGCFLAASAVAYHFDVFEAEGWKRVREVRNRKGETVRRPGGLTQLFTLLLIAGPLVPIVLAPLGVLPVTLLLTAVPLYFMPSLAAGFFEEIQDERWIGFHCAKLGVLAALLLFVGGLLAAY